MLFTEALEIGWGISVLGEMRDMVNVYFSGASAHFHLSIASQEAGDPLVSSFHRQLYFAHVRHLKRVLSEWGNFNRELNDEGDQAWNMRSRWSINGDYELPPGCFEAMPKPDASQMGIKQQNDVWLGAVCFSEDEVQ